jgi:hypothetical protein
MIANFDIERFEESCSTGDHIIQTAGPNDDSLPGGFGRDASDQRPHRRRNDGHQHRTEHRPIHRPDNLDRLVELFGRTYLLGAYSSRKPAIHG